MITVLVDSGKTVAAMQKIAAGLDDAARAKANRQIAVVLTKWVFDNFKAEGRLGTPGGWQPLALSTIMKRASKIKGKGKRAAVRGLYRKFGSTGGSKVSAALQQGAAKQKPGIGMFPILRDTGALRNSFLGFSDPNMAGVGAKQYIAKDNKAPADLAKIHQLGLGNVPARPMLPPVNQAAEMSLKVYRALVAKAIAP